MDHATDAQIRALLSGLDIEATDIQAADKGERWRVTGQRWVPVHVTGRKAPLQVAVPVVGEVHRAASGELVADFPPPQADEIEEAAAFARSLARHGQIGATARGGATHEIVADPSGRERLVRKRFSAR